jgi:hypothetical protein
MTNEAAMRRLRRAARFAGYKLNKVRGMRDWWRLTAYRPGTTYLLYESSFRNIAVAVLSDAIALFEPAPTIH